jgi:hypothetical protein
VSIRGGIGALTGEREREREMEELSRFERERKQL